jgi:hypothetical protein
MSDPSDDDMDQPVTKREFRSIVKNELVTKSEMREMFANFLDAIMERFASSEDSMKRWFSAQLARHTGAVDERHRTEVSVVDDKYKDLPERVTKLEAAVFPPPPVKRQRRR